MIIRELQLFFCFVAEQPFLHCMFFIRRAKSVVVFFNKLLADPHAKPGFLEKTVLGVFRVKVAQINIHRKFGRKN
jgi:hypothetical protein